jgi:hypothetical protein
MNGKDYIKLAAVMAQTCPGDDASAFGQWVRTKAALADVLEHENPKQFDRGKFMAACER